MNDTKTKTPLTVTSMAWLFIAAGITGIVYHAGEIRLDEPPGWDLTVGLFVRLLAVAGGVLMLRRNNFGRWLLVLWLAYHTALSAFHSQSQLLFHAALLIVISALLFRSTVSAFYREKTGGE